MSKGDVQDDTTLEQRAAELRAIIEAPDEKQRAREELGRIERQMAEVHESQGRSAAETRLLGIRRAHGSLAASLEGDEARVREAVATLTAAIGRMNDRYAQLAALRMEAGALCDRFGITSAELPRIAPPVQRVNITPTVTPSDYLRPRPATERCEHGMRERRTYREIEGTDGYAIIEAARLKPWPALTERQQQVVTQRAREQAETRRQLAPTLATAGALTRALDAVPGASGVTGV